MIGEVAPAAPAIPFALLALGSAIAFVVCYGLLHSWKRTVGYAFEWLASKSIGIPRVHVTVHPFGFLHSINDSVVHYLGQAVVATERAMVYSFHRMIGVIMWSAQEMAGLAQDVYNAIRGSATTVTHTVTKTLDAKTQALVRKLTVAVDTIQHVTIPNIKTRLRTLERTVAHGLRATGHAIASPFPRIKAAERDITNLRKHVRSIEKALAAGVGAALLIKALSKVGLGYIRCNNNKALGKRVCGADPLKMEEMLLGFTALLSTFSLVEFIRDAQAVEDLALDSFRLAIREIGDLPGRPPPSPTAQG